jgi:hypothetical protein
MPSNRNDYTEFNDPFLLASEMCRYNEVTNSRSLEHRYIGHDKIFDMAS